MVETCRKVQMAYLTSLDTVQLVEKAPLYDDILISVTSGPQSDSKEQSNLATMDETALTEEDFTDSTQCDDTSIEQNLFPADAEQPNNDSDVDHEINDGTVEPDAVDATAPTAATTHIVDGTVDEIPSNEDKQTATNKCPDDDGPIEISPAPQQAIVCSVTKDDHDDDSSMDTQDGALQIDIQSDGPNGDDVVAANDENSVSSDMMIDEIECTIPLDAAQTSSLSPAMASSPASADEIELPQMKSQIDGKFYSFESHNFVYKMPNWLFFDCLFDSRLLDDRQSSEQPSEPPAEKILVEEEEEACKSKSLQSNGDTAAQTNAATEEKYDEISMDDGEMAAIQLNENNGLKRKEMDDDDIGTECSPAKKYRPIEVNVDNGVLAAVVDGKWIKLENWAVL